MNSTILCIDYKKRQLKKLPLDLQIMENPS